MDIGFQLGIIWVVTFGGGLFVCYLIDKAIKTIKRKQKSVKKRHTKS